MSSHNYELQQVTAAHQLHGLLADGTGRITYVDGEPNASEREVIDILFEIIGDVSDISEDFESEDDWIKADSSINHALSDVNKHGHYLYAALIEKAVTDPFSGKEDSLPVMVLVTSKEQRNQIQLVPSMIDDLPASDI